MSIGLTTGIVIIVFIINEALKAYVFKTQKQRDALPLVGTILGAGIALGIFFFDKSSSLGIIVGDNALQAILTGAGSGLVATGGHQLYIRIAKLVKGDYTEITDKIEQSIGDDLKEIMDVAKETQETVNEIDKNTKDETL